MVHVAIGVVIAAAVLQTWFVLGWIVPMTVSGSSMAPALLGPHRILSLSRLSGANLPWDSINSRWAIWRSAPIAASDVQCRLCGSDERGDRLAVDRTAFAWRAPRRWEAVVFRCPENASDLVREAHCRSAGRNHCARRRRRAR